ncbi:MAG: tRNA (adenosine(37)-N6)-dimethylallyltransferase MiaA, partial [Chitinispirillales bacterium]|nr:tRNA (adenosine(37)-N6)-dimethylallyltransferase MiaA [Chitinispirillales bacterium]
HLIDIIEPDEEYSAARWVEDCRKSIETVRKKNKRPIICGGTFFYMNAMRFGFDVSSPQNVELRSEFMKYRDNNGNEELYKILFEKNPRRAVELHPNDTYRVIRALQIANDNPSILKKTENEKFLVFVLLCERKNLYDRVNGRVDLMIKNGLFEEYKSICEKYPGKNVPGRNCVGYREFDDYCAGKETFLNCVDKIKQHSRNFAKRQITWIKNKEKESFLIDVENQRWDAQSIAQTIAGLYFSLMEESK